MSYVRQREELYNQYLSHYKNKAKEDARYNKTVQVIKANKEKFMSGVPMEQVIRGKLDGTNN